MRLPPRDNVSGADGQLFSIRCDEFKILFSLVAGFLPAFLQDNFSFSFLLIIGSDISLYSKINYIFIQLTLYSCIFTVVFAKYIFYFIIFVTVLFHRVHCKTWRMSRFFRLNYPFWMHMIKIEFYQIQDTGSRSFDVWVCTCPTNLSNLKNILNFDSFPSWAALLANSIYSSFLDFVLGSFWAIVSSPSFPHNTGTFFRVCLFWAKFSSPSFSYDRQLGSKKNELPLDLRLRFIILY